MKLYEIQFFSRAAYRVASGGSVRKITSARESATIRRMRKDFEDVEKSENPLDAVKKLADVYRIEV